MTKIYHNARCSKSRQTLQLLEENGIKPIIIEYLKTPLTKDEITHILSLLGVSAHDLLRTKEPEFKEAGLGNPDVSDDEVINAMVKYPKLIERPIVVHNNKAAIGRPPESILEIL